MNRLENIAGGATDIAASHLTTGLSIDVSPVDGYKPPRWFIALLLTALVAGCGGGDGNTVVVSNLVSVAVTPATASIPISGTQQFAVTAIYSDGSSSVVTADPGTSWTSGDTNVATVLSTGVATGVATGQSTITAAFGGQTASATLTVTAATLTSIAVTSVPAPASIPMGLTQQFTATATYSDLTTADVTANLSTDWSAVDIAPDVGVASVGLHTGLATGNATGQSTITAAFGGQTATATLTVTAATLISIEVTSVPAPASIPMGLTQQFVATATYSDLTTADVTANPSTNWSAVDVVPDVGVASVGLHTGLATGNATGQSTITAAFGGQTASATLTVTAATVTSVEVTPATASVPVGGTQQFTATATYSDLTTADVTANLSTDWDSGTPAVATVGLHTGLATGATPGTSAITAAFGGQTSPAATLTVTDPGPAGAAPDLGTAGTYAVFASSDASVTLAADSLVTGDVGLMDGLGVCNTCTGVTVIGTIHNGDAAANQAQTDLNAAYADAATRSTNLCTLAANTEIADPQGACAFVTPGTPGPTYGPGLYWSATTINLGVGKTITLDAQNNPDAVFIFQAGTAITTGNGSIVVLANQAQARNVFWMAGTAATIGVSSIFKGTVIAGPPAAAAITVLGGTAVAPTTVTGRLFSSGAGIDVGTYATVTVPQ